MSSLILWRFKEEVHQMANYLLGLIGEYNRELSAILITIILIKLIVDYYKKYNEQERRKVDDTAFEFYKEMEEELLENIEDENVDGPVIDFEEKMDIFCLKRKIDRKLRESINLKLNDLLEDEDSILKKHFIYIDGDLISYVKLKNQENQNRN